MLLSVIFGEIEDPIPRMIVENSVLNTPILFRRLASNNRIFLDFYSKSLIFIHYKIYIIARITCLTFKIAKYFKSTIVVTLYLTMDVH